jgi:hypothetical protein
MKAGDFIFRFCLLGTAWEKHPVPHMPSASDKSQIFATRRKWLLRKIAWFLIASLLLGWFYGWASPRAFPKNSTFGFGYGMLHGALMPLALPSLLMGQDVEIFAANNSGRVYKIGYICGINVCGAAFFGPLFWRPKPRGENQKNHEREM